MKNKILIITIIIVLVAVLATGTIFVVRQIKKSKGDQEPTPVIPEPSLKETNTEILTAPATNKEQLNVQVQELSTVKATTKAIDLRALINQTQQA